MKMVVYPGTLDCDLINPSLISDYFFRELFLGNLVSQLMKIPQFEDPIKNVTDVVNRSITIFEKDYIFEISKDYYLNVNYY